MGLDPRAKTRRLAEKDVEEASRFARTITDDWYRSQSLAAVAWLHRGNKQTFLKVAKAALDAARKLPNPNRVVSCSAWTVRAMAVRPEVDPTDVVNELLELIGKEPNPVSRADALFLLLEACSTRPELRSKVLSQLLSTTLAVKSWKKARILSELALVLAVDEPSESQRVLTLIDNESLRRKTWDAISRGERLGPHEFFPHYKKTTEAHPVR